MPTNTAANAKLYGAELVYTKYFGNIGFTGNYAYTYSDIYAQKVDVTTGKPVYQHRPLQGQSDNELNASVEYRNDRKKIFVQLAYQYIGKTLSNVYANLGYDYYQQPQSFLALSAIYTAK